MKLLVILTVILICPTVFAQVLDEAHVDRRFVHASKGLSFRSGPDAAAEKLETLKYGTELKIVGFTDDEIEINGLKGRWAKVFIDKQEGYVFEAYLSKLPAVKVEDFHPHLCDYIYVIGDLIDGDKTCTINDNVAQVHSVFEQGEYRFKGDECDSEETLDLKDISVQEAYIIFSGFIPTYGGINFSKSNFKWSDSQNFFENDFYKTDDVFSHWYHVSFAKNGQDQFNYIEVYFEWEGGGGSLKIVENKKNEGVTVKKYYGCH